jgi:tRNA A37 threonylcarbamoyladenosine modification protein TsaB
MAYDIDIEHAMIEIFEDDHEIAQEHAPMIVEALKEICEKISKAAKKINATKYGSGPGGTPEKPAEGQNEEI